MKKNSIRLGALSAAAIAGALMLPVGIATANPCTNSASPFCATSGLPVEMPLSPASDACSELARYGTGGDLHTVSADGLTASVPQEVVSAAHAAGCPLPPSMAGLAY